MEKSPEIELISEVVSLLVLLQSSYTEGKINSSQYCALSHMKLYLIKCLLENEDITSMDIEMQREIDDVLNTDHHILSSNKIPSKIYIK